MRFRAEFDMYDDDCSRCPLFRPETDDLAVCRLSEVRDEPFLMNGFLVSHHGTVGWRFPMPLDCPLEAVASRNG